MGNKYKKIRTPDEQEGVPLIIGSSFVRIPTTRYDELIRAEAELDVLLRGYQHLEGYQLENAIKAVFGSKPKTEDEDF